MVSKDEKSISTETVLICLSHFWLWSSRTPRFLVQRDSNWAIEPQSTFTAQKQVIISAK